MRVTVKRNERDSGLRRLWNHERGAEIRIDGERVGSIGFARAYGDQKSGWYFSIWTNPKWGIRLLNTGDNRVPEYEDAKKAALAYVKAELAKAQSDG